MAAVRRGALVRTGCDHAPDGHLPGEEPGDPPPGSFEQRLRLADRTLRIPAVDPGLDEHAPLPEAERWVVDESKVYEGLIIGETITLLPNGSNLEIVGYGRTPSRPLA